MLLRLQEGTKGDELAYHLQRAFTRGDTNYDAQLLYGTAQYSLTETATEAKWCSLDFETPSFHQRCATDSSSSLGPDVSGKHCAYGGDVLLHCKRRRSRLALCTSKQRGKQRLEGLYLGFASVVSNSFRLARCQCLRCGFRVLNDSCASRMKKISRLSRHCGINWPRWGPVFVWCPRIAPRAEEVLLLPGRRSSGRAKCLRITVTGIHSTYKFDCQISSDAVKKNMVSERRRCVKRSGL